MTNNITSYRFPTQIYFGPGAIDELPAYLEQAHISKPLIVTDPGVFQSPVYPKLEGVLKAAGIPFAVFSEIHPNPLDKEIMAAFAVYAENACDGLIGFGGGSALDAGKVVQAMAAHGGEPADYSPGMGGTKSITGPLPSLIAIPTTAGTGSEVGNCSVVTSEAEQRKYMICNPILTPTIALLDPELTVSLPPHLTAATGMDAFTHCVEALCVKMIHPMCDGIALQGIEYVADNLETAVKEPDNIEARGKMQLAAMMGAVSFQKDLGTVHSLSHSLSAVCHVPHGLANAVCLATVMEFNKNFCLDEYAKVAARFGVNILEMSKEEAADKAIEAVRDLNRRIGIPERLSEVGVKESDLEELADKAFMDGCHATNPRSCTREDLLALYRAAL